MYKIEIGAYYRRKDTQLQLVSKIIDIQYSDYNCWVHTHMYNNKGELIKAGLWGFHEFKKHHGERVKPKC